MGEAWVPRPLLCADNARFTTKDAKAGRRARFIAQLAIVDC